VSNRVTSNSVTIDNYPADAAIEYAKNVAIYEPHYVAPAALFELATIMTKFAEMEKIFGLMRRRRSWARFSPPPNFFRQLNRFYATAIIPSLSSLQIHNLMEEHIDLPPRVEQMLLTLDELNRWLEEITCRVLEYRKG
jgi:hypothetical protein